jgi:hypothetical protein
MRSRIGLHTPVVHVVPKLAICRFSPHHSRRNARHFNGLTVASRLPLRRSDWSSEMWPLDTRATWILIAWLTPVWWASLLVMVAWLGDVFPSWHALASRLFNHLESMY